MVLLIIAMVFGLIGQLVGSRLKSKFEQYSQVPVRSGMTGAEVARAMLKHYGITNVNVVSVDGFLSDHYNPENRTVNLSPAVYNERSVAAAAVAAHECGHAVQHATSYSMLEMRSKLVPAVQFATNAQQFIQMALLGGGAFFLSQGGGAIGNIFFIIALAVFGTVALFATVTLPVEFDASRRALEWLDSSGVAGRGEEYDGAKDALTWAALTYVVNALGAIASFLYILMIFLGNRRNEE